MRNNVKLTPFRYDGRFSLASLVTLKPRCGPRATDSNSAAYDFDGILVLRGRPCAGSEDEAQAVTVRAGRALC